MGLPVLRRAMEKKGGLLTKDEAVEAMQQETATFHPRTAWIVIQVKISAIVVWRIRDVYPRVRIFCHPGSQIRIQRKKSSVADSGPGAFLTPGSGMKKNPGR